MPQPEHELLAVDWYHRAIHDFHSATVLQKDDPTDPNAVWLAQQAAEKAIKCLLVLEQVVFRKIHDLEETRALLPDHYQLKSDPPSLSSLTKNAIETRYPGDFEPLEEAEVHTGIALAARVIELLQKEFDPLVLQGIDPATGEPYS